VRFHDGTPFTSADVFSLNRAMSDSSDYKDYLSSVAAVAAIDEHAVLITTIRPNPILPDQLGQVLMMSRRWAEEHDALVPTEFGDELTYAEHHANGTGPFKLVSFEAGVSTVLSRNPDWWGLGQNPRIISMASFTR
jgi:peptide/nickel transport system substrate-binding protein